MYLDSRPVGTLSGHQAGRELLGQMYHAYVGGQMPAIALTERGKPYFTEGPWHFSISHTQHFVFCALSLRNIGIDAEETDRPVRPELAKRMLSQKEYAQYASADHRDQAFLKLWVLKEAWVKLTGEGLKGIYHTPEFTLTDPRIRQLQNCFVAVMEEENHVI